MKVLVTGAGGFLGRHVVSALSRRGHLVRALVRTLPDERTPGWNAPNVEVHVADLRMASNLENAVAGTQAVLHLAAELKGDDESRIAGTLDGTKQLLAAMAKCDVKRLVLASSLSVYDWHRTHGTLDETSPVETDGAGRDGYAIAKIRQEHAVRATAEKLGWDLTVMRPGAIWGPQAEYLPIIGQSVGPLHLVVAGARMLPLTHVANCADAFAAVVDNEKTFGQTFNVIDEPQISAWKYMGQYLYRNHLGGIRVPLSYGFAAVAVRLANVLGKPVLGQRMPSILVPKRFDARFKPLNFTTNKLKRLAEWTQPLNYEACVGGSFDINGTLRIEAAAAGATADGWVA